MTKIYTKSTWVDEILSGAERYDIKTDFGTPVESNVQINLATVVATAGTAVDAEKMNNIENGIDGLDTLVAAGGVSIIHAATSKTPPVDADELPLVDSALGFALKKLTWANIKATIKTYFDTLYNPIVTPGTAGNMLASNGTNWVSLASNYRLTRILNIYNGTTTYTPTAGTRALYVECIGGGGAGGGAAVASSNLSLGSGGASGQCTAAWVTSINGPYSVSVGAGGTGVSGAAGNAGGNSSFISNSSVTICSSCGGAGGTVLSAGTSIKAEAGASGYSSAVGDLILKGGDGCAGLRLSATVGVAGSGGGAPMGGGLAAGLIVNASSAAVAGVAGGNYGGGGSGAITTGAVQTGGAGAPGVIRVWEFA